MAYENILFISFSVINIIFSSIIFAAFILFKTKLSKHDTLISQKYFVQFCFFAACLCGLVVNSSESNMKNEYMGTSDGVYITLPKDGNESLKLLNELNKEKHIILNLIIFVYFYFQ